MSPLRPGELILFHGMVGGQRGTCLVLAALPIPGQKKGVQVSVLARDMRLIMFNTDYNDQELMWSRINERQCT